MNQGSSHEKSKTIAYAQDGSKRKKERKQYTSSQLAGLQGGIQFYTPLILSKGKPCTGKDL